MRPLVRLGLGLAGLAAILLGVAMGLPNHVRVARSIVINAPESAVFPYVNNLRRFTQWSPWAERDQTARFSFSGPEEGKGARMEWTSEKRGSGSLEITESSFNRVTLAVDVEGMGEATSSWQLAPAGSGTRLTWGYDSETGNNPVKRWRGLLLDRVIGSQYNAGLARLKALVEGEGQPVQPAQPAQPAPAQPAQPVPAQPVPAAPVVPETTVPRTSP